MSRRRSNSRNDNTGEDEVVNPNNGEEETDVVFGIRGSRRSVSYQHRHSSANHPHRIMEQEVYYDFAENVLDHANRLSQIVALLTAIFHYCTATISTLTFGDSIEQLRQKLVLIKKAIDRICFLISWISSYGELALLYAEDLTVFIRPRRIRWIPHRYRTLDDINPEDCDTWFGLSPFDLRQLFVHWRVPTTLRTESRSAFQGEA